VISTSPVSVILPFRNASATVDDAIGSIAAQSLNAFERQLIDNGSLDGCAARAAAAATRDARFRLLRADGGWQCRDSRGVTAISATPSRLPWRSAFNQMIDAETSEVIAGHDHVRNDRTHGGAHRAEDRHFRASAHAIHSSV
jgi:glycosyltransferase involved in cell wall biosynthesis